MAPKLTELRSYLCYMYNSYFVFEGEGPLDALLGVGVCCWSKPPLGQSVRAATSYPAE